MKKLFALFAVFLTSIFFLSFTACDSSKIEIGANENGIVYFHHSNEPLGRVLSGGEYLTIENPTFFEKLVNCINGKPTTKDPLSNDAPNYVVKIEKYTFELYPNYIRITSPMGNNIKGAYTVCVECTAQEANTLFDILDR